MKSPNNKYASNKKHKIENRFFMLVPTIRFGKSEINCKHVGHLSEAVSAVSLHKKPLKP